MKGYLALLLLLASIPNPLFSQVVAGQSDGLNFATVDLQLQNGAIPFGELLSLSDSVDVTGDGIDDIKFGTTQLNTFDALSGSIYVRPFNPQVEIMVSGEKVRRLNWGDPVVADSTWATGMSFGFVSAGSGFSGDPATSGEWVLSQFGYMGVRLLFPADTFYGWFNVQAFVNPSSAVYLRVWEYAIEPLESTTQNLSDSGFRVFPNPCVDFLELVTDKPITVRCFNILGQLVKEETITANTTWDITSWPPGSYGVTFVSNGKKWLQKIVKQ